MTEPEFDVTAELLAGPTPAPDADAELDALNALLADVDYRPDGHTRLWVGARRGDDGKLWIGANLLNAEDNRTGAPTVYTAPASFHGDPTDVERVKAHVAWVCAWSAAHEALENLHFRGERIHDPHSPKFGEPVVVLPGILLDDHDRQQASKAINAMRVRTGLVPTGPNRSARRAMTKRRKP